MTEDRCDSTTAELFLTMLAVNKSPELYFFTERVGTGNWLYLLIILPQTGAVLSLGSFKAFLDSYVHIISSNIFNILTKACARLTGQPPGTQIWQGPSTDLWGLLQSLANVVWDEWRMGHVTQRDKIHPQKYLSSWYRNDNKLTTRTKIEPDSLTIAITSHTSHVKRKKKDRAEIKRPAKMYFDR